MLYPSVLGLSQYNIYTYFFVGHCLPLLSLCNGSNVFATARMTSGTTFLESHVMWSGTVTEF
jgi:hypothetical protein